MTIYKIVNPGLSENGQVYCRIEVDDKGTLSISGVEGPLALGNCRGSCGQIRGVEIKSFSKGWNQEMLRKFYEIWKEWHLNDMQAACEHQQKHRWGEKEIEVVTYRLTTEALKERRGLEKTAIAVAAGTASHEFSHEDRALLTAPITTHQPPDADGPLSGRYEVSWRETKLTAWVNQDVHPEGVLAKPCPECGYKYGTEWRRKEVPQDVLEWLKELPESKREPAWV